MDRPLARALVLVNVCKPLLHEGPYAVLERIECEGGCEREQSVRRLDKKGDVLMLPVIFCFNCARTGGQVVCEQCGGRYLYVLSEAPKGFRE